MARRTSSGKAVHAALVGNALIAATKFSAAAWTGSSAMLSEAVHSLVDTSNELLLLYGMHRAKRPANFAHPFGHGRELYFWSFIVALMVFGLGAGVSLYEGISHIRNPVGMERPLVNYAVLGISFVFELGSWLVAFREFRASKGKLGYLEAVGVAKDPTTFTVLFEDSAALVGLVIAFIGIACAQALQMSVLDGVASIGIALVLATTGIMLARRTKELLIGEAADQDLQRHILHCARTQPGIASANGVITSQLGPHQVVVLLSAEFEDNLNSPQIERCIETLERAIRSDHPEVVAVFVRPQTAADWEARRAAVARGNIGSS